MAACEAIWVAADDVDKSYIEPLTHLLAAAVARDTQRLTAIYTEGGNPPFLLWNSVTSTFDNVPLNVPINLRNLCASFGGFTPNVHRYLFVVNPAHPRVSIAAPGEKFDRIAFLTDALRTVLPPDFRALLSALAPLFSCFIPSVVRRTPSTFSAAAAVLAAILTGGEPNIEVRAIADDVPDDPTLPLFSEDEIISRDACTLRFDLALVLAEWTAWVIFAMPFFNTVTGSHQRTAEAWGRAVTNRRVGVAVSGGGASGYRAGPLLEELATQNVPVDAFAGLSGGALVGAYYCCKGKVGFDLAVTLGPFFSLSMPVVLLTSWPLAFVTDVMLGGELIEELEVRFVPVTTALPPGKPPFAAIVVSGTVGDGVRASGTLPPAFGPTRQNGVGFTDGASTALVPLRILRDYGGADAILVCDINPGPARSNPFDWSPVGRFLHDYTPVGRLLDSWATTAFFSERATRSFAMTADAYVAFPPLMIPLFESVMFFNSWGIIASAKTAQALLVKKVNKLKLAWKSL